MSEPTQGELLGREFITAVVMFHEAVGRSMGLTAVERKTLDVLKYTEDEYASGGRWWSEADEAAHPQR